jgi:hypothetical protein
MANEYAPRQFLRHAKMALLQKYFARRKALAHIEWEKLKETEIESIYDAWQALPEQTREEVEWEFRRVHGMATADGTLAVVEEGRFHGLDLTSDLDALHGYVNKAFWAFLEHRKVFDVAAMLNRADHLNGRYWRKRKDLPRKDPDVSSEALAALAAVVSAYYWENQGRGQNCRAETYLRAGRYHYFFVYPQDYTDTFVGYSQAGEFERRPQNPAFEVIFVYDPTDGTLDLYVRGDKKIVRDMQELFGRTILHEELGEENRNSVPYHLNVLKQRDFSFPTDPADGVLEVKVPSLRLSVVGNRRKRITFETDPKEPKGAVYDFIESAVHEKRLPPSMVDVSSAVIHMVFDNTDGAGRDAKPLSFRISYPDSCNLKDSPEALVAKKYLKEWKIDRS